MDIAFFGKTVPLAGAKRPVSNVIQKTITHEFKRMADGRYLGSKWMENRCCNSMEVSSRVIYVVDNFGDLVPVEYGDRAWY